MSDSSFELFLLLRAVLDYYDFLKLAQAQINCTTLPKAYQSAQKAQTFDYEKLRSEKTTAPNQNKLVV